MARANIQGLTSLPKRLSGPSTHKAETNYIFHKDVAVNGDLYVKNLIFGAVQPNLIYRAHKCESDMGWFERSPLRFKKTAFNDATNYPPVVDTVIKLTQTPTGAGQVSDIVWFTFDHAQDFSFMDYIGFFYRGTALQTYDHTALNVLLFPDVTKVLPYPPGSETLTSEYAVESHAYCAADWTEDTNSTWKYSEIELNSSNRDARKRIRAIGFESVKKLTNVEADRFVYISKIDIYKLGTGYGPVRGRMIAMPIATDNSVSAGDLVDLTEEGSIKVSVNQTDSFLGVVARSQNYGLSCYSYGYSHGPEVCVYVQVDGVVNLPVGGAGFVLLKGTGLSSFVNGWAKLAKAGAIYKHLGINLRNIPTWGGTYPILIGSRGSVGTQ